MRWTEIATLPLPEDGRGRGAEGSGETCPMGARECGGEPRPKPREKLHTYQPFSYIGSSISTRGHLYEQPSTWRNIDQPVASGCGDRIDSTGSGTGRLCLE